MGGKWFPGNTQLAERLKIRFGSSAGGDVAAAKNLTDAASKARWVTPAEIEERKNELRLALSYLESNVDNELTYLHSAVDLQVTKASALRTYSALVSGVAIPLFLLTTPSRNEYILLGLNILLGLTVLLCIASALLTVSARWTSLPTNDNFSTAMKERDWLVGLLGSRGRRVNLAVLATFFATTTLVLAFLVAGYDRHKRNATDAAVDPKSAMIPPTAPPVTALDKPKTKQPSPVTLNPMGERDAGKDGAPKRPTKTADKKL